MQVLVNGLQVQVSVEVAIRRALELLSNPGMKVANYSVELPGGRGDTDAFVSRADAKSLLKELLLLPAERNIALMARVHADDIRKFGDYLVELVSFAGHHIGEAGLRFGVEGLIYWVRHWARKDGSFREFGLEYGVDKNTAAKFYREVIEPVLTGWYVAAKGAIEPVVALVYGDPLEENQELAA
jgi:hypothetical protein